MRRRPWERTPKRMVGKVRISRFKKTNRLAVSLISLVAVSGAVLAASPAGATSASDPIAGCSSDVDDGACISAISADYTSTTVTLGITVGAATDPTTDPNWDLANTGNNETAVLWEIYVDGSTTPNWIAVATDVDNVSGPPTFTGGVFSPSTGDPGCLGAPEVSTSFSTSANTYGIEFPG